jgi:thiol-disulfide isomerase/thioredoxin
MCKGVSHLTIIIPRLASVQVIRPSLGCDDIGFSSHVGQFDSLVDTLGNEQSLGLSMDDDLVSNDEGFYDIGHSFGPSVLQLLKTQHHCNKYVSTLTHCQEVVMNEGIFGGPGKAEQYSQRMGNLDFLRTSRDCQALPPVKLLGKTVESLMTVGVILTDVQRRKMCSKTTDAVRGWSLSDLWETTSWPRDSSGSGTVRYGLPVRQDPSEEEGDVKNFLISESPYRPDQASSIRMDEEEFVEIGDFGLTDDKDSASDKSSTIQNNPYVLNILGLEGMQSEIVERKMDCIMFLSAKFCKTCRSIYPLYSRMARLSQENDTTKITFVRAEASGESGKALGRHLSVQAVPCFVLFREGRQFGVPLSVSKLPSRKIDRALALLATGSPWDGSILDEDDSSTSIVSS